MPDSALAIILTVPDSPQRVGVAVPVRVEVHNTSTGELWMVGVLDGSEAGYRYPHYKPSILAPKPLPAVESEGCGNVAPLRLEDFCRLAPGESFDPTMAHNGSAYLPLYTFANFIPPSSGRYELRLTLSTASETDEDWLGMRGYPGEEEVLERLKLVPRMSVESNVAIIQVSG